jgi:hypothetical protein
VLEIIEEARGVNEIEIAEVRGAAEDVAHRTRHGADAVTAVVLRDDLEAGAVLIQCRD